MRRLALAAAATFLSAAAAAEAEDPGYTLGRVLATFAEAETCGFPLAPEQRHVLAAAGLRLQREARISNAELKRLVADIGNTMGRDVCERGREGCATETSRLVEDLGQQRGR